MSLIKAYQLLALLLLSGLALRSQPQLPIAPDAGKLRICAALPVVQLSGQAMSLEARRQIANEFTNLLSGPASPLHLVSLQGILDVEMRTEAAQQRCSHVWQIWITRISGEGLSGLGSVGKTVQNTATEATAITNALGGSKAGSSVGMATRVAGALLSRKSKTYEMTLRYELTSLSAAGSPLKDSVKNTGRTAEDAILPDLLQAAANRLSVLATDILKSGMSSASAN